jgi:hypothetical protein
MYINLTHRLPYSYEQNSNWAGKFNKPLAHVNVCYPTDANSVDGRVRDDGVATKDTDGLGGCHTDDTTTGIKDRDQDPVCDSSVPPTCLSGSTNCKCYYDGVPGKKAGEWISKYSSKICGKGEKKPNHDFVVSVMWQLQRLVTTPIQSYEETWSFTLGLCCMLV